MPAFLCGIAIYVALDPEYLCVVDDKRALLTRNTARCSDFGLYVRLQRAPIVARPVRTGIACLQSLTALIIRQVITPSRLQSACSAALRCGGWSDTLTELCDFVSRSAWFRHCRSESAPNWVEIAS